MLSRSLTVCLQAAQHSHAVVVREELCVVWEIVDEPVAGDTDENRGEALL